MVDGIVKPGTVSKVVTGMIGLVALVVAGGLIVL